MSLLIHSIPSRRVLYSRSDRRKSLGKTLAIYLEERRLFHPWPSFLPFIITNRRLSTSWMRLTRVSQCDAIDSQRRKLDSSLPFVLDAALDFKNVSIVANYIKERTRNAQFVIISLRNNMFELADRLVGIYKTDNCTKSVTINPRAFGIEARQNGLLATTPALLNRTNKTISSEAKESARRRLTIQSTDSSRSSIENTGE